MICVHKKCLIMEVHQQTSNAKLEYMNVHHQEFDLPRPGYMPRKAKL